MGDISAESRSYDEVLASLLTRRRKDLGFSQAALAAELGMDQATVSKIECGHRRLSFGESISWMKVLGLNLEETKAVIEVAWEEIGDELESLWVTEDEKRTP